VAIDTLYYQAPPVNQTAPGTFLFDYNYAVVAEYRDESVVSSTSCGITSTAPILSLWILRTGNYHLQTTSPVIDMGNNNALNPMPAVDIDGNNRIIVVSLILERMR